MDTPIDLERLSAAFADHPWLPEAISNGAWWGSDGTVNVVPPVEDPLVIRAGLLALADALGCRREDVRVGAAVDAAGGPWPPSTD